LDKAAKQKRPPRTPFRFQVSSFILGYLDLTITDQVGLVVGIHVPLNWEVGLPFGNRLNYLSNIPILNYWRYLVMWHTSHGDRTLRGQEAAVFAESMRSLLDFAATMGWDQYPVEIPAFDNLTSGQKVHALLTVAQGLLCEEVPKVQLTAALEATVAAVFYQLETMVTLELDDPEAGHYWKDRVKAALNDAEANTANFVPGTGIPAAGESGDDPFNLPPGDEALKQAIRDGLEIAQHDMLEDVFRKNGSHRAKIEKER
jgi:hypothetical protein